RRYGVKRVEVIRSHDKRRVNPNFGAPDPNPLPQKIDVPSLSLTDRFSTSIFRGRGDKKSRAKRNKTDSTQTANISQHSTFS
ncbi:MAG: hypothetical protein ACC628_09715, partial [Pirellulaceae bacterium]